MSTVRAKFFVKEIRHLHTGSKDSVAAEIAMSPVYGDGTDNAVWSKYTPQGELKMMITNPPAIDAFEIGKQYYLDFTPAD